MKYFLTPETFQYLKDNSSLLATLACLLAFHANSSDIYQLADNSTEEIINSQLSLIEQFCECSLQNVYHNLKRYIDSCIRPFNKLFSSEASSITLSAPAQNLFLYSNSISNSDECIWNTVMKLLKLEQFETVMDIINELPDNIFHEDVKWKKLHDLLVLVSVAKNKNYANLLCLIDNMLYLERILECIDMCSVDQALILLKHAHHRGILDDKVAHKRRTMQVYKQV